MMPTPNQLYGINFTANHQLLPGHPGEAQPFTPNPEHPIADPDGNFLPGIGLYPPVMLDQDPPVPVDLQQRLGALAFLHGDPLLSEKYMHPADMVDQRVHRFL
jgi:hypothetical protein